MVNSGLVAVLKAPNESSEVQTYYYFGEEITVFDRVGDYLWCQSSFDRYVGYVLKDKVEIDSLNSGGHFIATMGSYIYSSPDLRTRAFDFLPRHARVHVIEVDIEVRGSRYVRLSNGFYLLDSCVSVTPPTSIDIAAAAAKYLGCPYLWAGKSFLGVDCSGLIQNCFRDIGDKVLRDTDMQRETIGVGSQVDDIDALERDDLLYMPGHVMVYEGHGTVIHADGKSMTVRREEIAEFLQSRALSLKSMTVRRPDRKRPEALKGAFEDNRNGG